MKQLQVIKGREFVILESPVPEPGPGEALVKIEAVTTCPQWDMHLRHDDPMFVGHQFFYPYTPGQPGHEAVGVVVRTGEEVAGLAVGDRVAVWRDPGHENPGCYAQFVVRPQDDLIRVPLNIPLHGLAPLELAMCVACTFLRLKSMNAIQGRRFGVAGLGPAGLIAGQMAAAEGAAEVVGFDLSAARREAALKGVFSRALDPRDPQPDLPPRPPRLGEDWTPGLDCSVDCVGAKASVEFLMDRTSETVALFGVQREEYSFAPRHWLSLALVGYPPHHRQAAEYAADLIAEGRLDLTPLVTHHLVLEDYALAVDLLERQEAVKVCFWPWGIPPEVLG